MLTVVIMLHILVCHVPMDQLMI